MKKLFIWLMPFWAITLFIFIKFKLKGVLDSMPFCVTYGKYGIYCPGCGNTRAVKALLNGDIPLSLRCNPIIVFIILLMILWYLEFAFNKKILPRSYMPWAVLIILFIVYYIARNFVPILYIP